jgi:hypothetical protein
MRQLDSRWRKFHKISYWGCFTALGWFGHIERMQETRMVKAIHTWKPISRRPIGRPNIRWEDDVRKDIVQKLKVTNWKTLVQDRRRKKELVEKAETLHKEL